MKTRCLPLVTSAPPRAQPAQNGRVPELITELEAVEATLADCTVSEVELLQVAARHILDAGGKRFRPQLTLLSAQSLGYGGARTVPLAAVMELIHTATLVHDDIVDASDSRRGRATANLFWGNSASVLMGDYLVIRAFSLLAQDGDPRLLTLMCDTIARMCEGEVLQLGCRGNLDLSEEVYFQIIECKTAALMALCCHTAAIVADGSGDDTAILARFGRCLGMAFQIQDDVLDYLGDEKLLGKPVGGDLREAKVTLPLILALQRATPEDRRSVEEVFTRTAPITPVDVASVSAMIDRYSGFERARDAARAFLRDAQGALAELSPSGARDALSALADRVVDRER
jgi:octaprenyl-diphosphate synthase